MAWTLSTRGGPIPLSAVTRAERAQRAVWDGPRTQARHPTPSGREPRRRSAQIEPIEVHHLVPHSHEVGDEPVLRVAYAHASAESRW